MFSLFCCDTFKQLSATSADPVSSTICDVYRKSCHCLKPGTDGILRAACFSGTTVRWMAVERGLTVSGVERGLTVSGVGRELTVSGLDRGLTVGGVESELTVGGVE